MARCPGTGNVQGPDALRGEPIRLGRRKGHWYDTESPRDNKNRLPLNNRSGDNLATFARQQASQLFINADPESQRNFAQNRRRQSNPHRTLCIL